MYDSKDDPASGPAPMAHVNPDILVWARETAGLTVEDAAEKLSIKSARGVAAADRLSALEKGEKEPTRPMLAKMAKLYRRPLLVFYLANPPPMADRGQDFRTLPEDYSSETHSLLDALVRDVRSRQSMVRAVLEDDPDVEPLNFIGSMKTSDGVQAVLDSIKDTLGVGVDSLSHLASPEKAFALLREKVEAIGVFVLLLGNLGSHHTAIDVDIFRGFALADKIAPFIVINDQDAQSAWSFTLLHELTHLWIGETGVSGTFSDNSVERFCNDVASEFLLPTEDLLTFSTSSGTSAATLAESISAFAAGRNVSNSLVAYRLFRAGRINSPVWQQLHQHFRTRWLETKASRRARAKEREGGPNYYVVRRHRIGDALLAFVRRTMAEGELTTLKAGKVLGVKPKNVQALLDVSARPIRRAM